MNLPLPAGTYQISIVAFANETAGSNLSAGFLYDNDQPVPIAEWWINGTGSYHLVIDGVDEAAVPIPSSVVLLGAGFLLTVGIYRKKRSTLV